MPSSRQKERHRSIPLLPEIRRYDIARDDLEVRATEGPDGSTFQIAGQATTLGSYVVQDAVGEFEETMAADVGAEVISRGVDCRLLVGHDHRSLPLARTASGTMRLISSATGLRFEADLDRRSHVANDVAVALRRGDLSGVSVGFTCGRDSWNKDMTQRRVESFSDLPEISLVAYPAQPATSVDIRSAMFAALPVESRARLRALYANARRGKLSDEEIMLVRALLYADIDADPDSSEQDVPRLAPRADPVVAARELVARSRSQRRAALLENAARVKRSRPLV